MTSLDLGGVDILAGLKNVFGGLVTSIESATSAATASNIPNVTTSPASGGLFFGTVQDAEAAVMEIKELIADIEAGKWSDLPEDVIKLVKTVFAILARFKINVPVVSSIVEALPDLPAVAKAA